MILQQEQQENSKAENIAVSTSILSVMLFVACMLSQNHLEKSIDHQQKVLVQEVITKKSETWMDWKQDEKGNYHFDNSDHDIQTVSQSKTVKRTIKLELPGETDKPVVQQVTFTRHGIKDLVTGKTTWGSWDHNGKYQFDSYTPQTIAGYEATSDKVDSLLVTPESKDSEVTISYHKLATKPTVNPQTSQEPAAYTPKVQISQVSQPVVATQPKIEPQQELPHTGNDNETALATGFMGLLLAIGSLSFGKKYRI
ncbi:LPXTG cell wall anchor domain-containing protein [Limosilactobacillus vaginalis]|uniref:mucin-binding protein n=1 Tax=Limosilactobacillus vaginalis TaxID=1633 RepID=UPI0021B61890|nr:LPXTG cell wall anchor domain-containing protein [Limosilactobacillus vaginalis]UXC69748.1 LPXTG cell wall anchor domain-containing protein [Limosilactobacillus vaginalis]